MKTLVELGQDHGTDKVINGYCGVSYLDVYARYLDPVRDKVARVLELGIHKGASLRMWRDYFPNAQIHGLDINPGTAFEDERITCFIGDMSVDRDIHRLIEKPYDLIVDDASHLVDHQVYALEKLWSRVVPGGIYVIEDLGCSWSDVTGCSKEWPGQHLNSPGTNYANDRTKLDAAFRAYLYEMDRLRGDCAFLHFWPMQAILGKVV